MKLIKFVLISFLIAAPAIAEDRGTAAEAEKLVNDAIAYINEKGDDVAYAEINNIEGLFRDRDLYVFVMEHEGKMLAHGANKGLIGRNILSLKDPNGVAFIQGFKETVETKGSGWVDYKWPDPKTKKVLGKSTFVKDLDGKRLVGCGIYKD